MAPAAYANFDVLIDRSPAGYRARVIQSPTGDAAVDFTLPFKAYLTISPTTFVEDALRQAGKEPVTKMTNPRPNPYPGPRPFRRGETLYGRQRETAELLDLLIAERIALLASPSGAGKTSLVQAALVPALEAEGFRVLPVMRPGLLPEDAPPGGLQHNRYVLSLLLGLERAWPDEEQTPLQAGRHEPGRVPASPLAHARGGRLAR